MAQLTIMWRGKPSRSRIVRRTPLRARVKHLTQLYDNCRIVIQ